MAPVLAPAAADWGLAAWQRKGCPVPPRKFCVRAAP